MHEEILSLASIFYKIAALNDEIAKLDCPKEIIDFILNIQDASLKGQVFNFVKKQKPNSINDIRSFVNELETKKSKKTKLQISDIPEEFLHYYNILTSEKLKIYLRGLARRNILPKISPDLLEKLNVVQHFLAEELKDTDISDFNFDKLYKAAKSWEDSFKSKAKEITGYDPVIIVYGPKWKNQEFDGHFICEMKSDKDLRLEGSILNHCVGGGAYLKKIKSGESRVFSLRTPSNHPLLTIETSSDLYNFKQTFGSHNAQPAQMQASMLDEWKRSLHPKDKILALVYSRHEPSKIKSAQFMDYSDPDYKSIIDNFINEEKDSGSGFLGSAVSNDPKDVLQALAANETLIPEAYVAIYKKCKNNSSTVFNLIRNPKIPDQLFGMIYEDNSNESSAYHTITQAIASSFAIGKSSNQHILLDLIKKTLEGGIDESLTLKYILNNPSIKSSVTTQIINSFSKDTISYLLQDTKDIEHLEPKFIDDLLESTNPFVKDYLFKIAVYNNNVTNQVLLKFYKKFGIKPVLPNKEDLIGDIMTKHQDVILDFIRNTDLPKANLTSKQIDLLISKEDMDIDFNLAKRQDLSDEQSELLWDRINTVWRPDAELDKSREMYQAFDGLVANRPSFSNEQFEKLFIKDGDFRVLKNPNLTKEQVDIILTLLQSDSPITGRNKQLSSFAKKCAYQNLAEVDRKLTDEQFSVLINKCPDYLAINKQLSENQIDQLLSLTDDELINFGANAYTIKCSIAYNPKLSQKHLEYLLNLTSSINDKNIYKIIAGYTKLTEKQFEQLLEISMHTSFEMLSSLASNPFLTRSQIDQLFKYELYGIYNGLCKNPNLTKEDIDKLLLISEDGSGFHNLIAQYCKLTDDQIDQLIELKYTNNDFTKTQLAFNPNLTLSQAAKVIKLKPTALSKQINKKTAKIIYNSLMKLASIYNKLCMQII